MTKILWSRLAVQDLDSIADHYADIAPDFTVRIEDALLAAADFLRDAPGAGSVFGSAGVRKWSLARLPYVILYRSDATGIAILRIHHARQNWRMS